MPDMVTCIQKELPNFLQYTYALCMTPTSVLAQLKITWAT